MHTSLYRTLVRSLAGIFIAATLLALEQSVADAAGRSRPSNGIGSDQLFGEIAAVVFVAFVALLIASTRRDTRRRRDSEIRDRFERETATNEMMKRIATGDLKQIDAVGVVPLRGERFDFAQDATHGQMHSARAFQANSPALYIPLGHGLRARVAHTKGRSAVENTFMWDAKGTVFASNLRICFKPSESPELISIPFSTVLSYDLHDDGLALNVDHLGVQQFRTGDPSLGALFKKRISEMTSTGV